MGGALLGGLLRSGWAQVADVTVVEPAPERRDELEAEFPGLQTLAAPEAGVLSDGGERVAGAVLAVKPDAADGACRALGVTGVTRVLSIVAGMPCARLEAALGGEPTVVRAMPNTPALVGAGVTAISGGSFATSRDLAWAEDVLAAVGTVVRLPERMLDAVTGLSGSGPAYFFLVAEALMEAGRTDGAHPRRQPHARRRDDARLGRALAGDGSRPGGPARHGDLARGHHGRRHQDTGGPRRALGLHGGGGRRHGTIAQPAALSAERRVMTSESPRTVFFLSDFGTEDEFVGVVHAVIAARAPGTTVIDLTHHIPPFDVRAGSHTLARAVPYLSPGVVLAVVDPGVGTERRGIGLRVALPSGGSLCFVGPDNGLLVAAAEAAAEAPVAHVVELARRPPPPERGRHLRRARPVRPRCGRALRGRRAGGSRGGDRPACRWCVSSGASSRRDASATDARASARRSPGWTTSATSNWRRPSPTPGWPGSPSRAASSWRPASSRDDQHPDGLPQALVPDGVQLRCVDAFGELQRGEFGLLVDANGHLAVVAGEASAAGWLNVAAGELLVLAW